MQVIAYTYEADYHCVECTQKRHAAGGFRIAQWANMPGLDEHGIPYEASDREQNLVHAVFNYDDMPDGGRYCGDCHKQID